LPARNTRSENRAREVDLRGIVFEIERYALHDGPGIRTLVFLKGCPLECRWCSNPESQENRPRLQYYSEKCIACRQCIEVCPHGALGWLDRVEIDHAACRRCGTCAHVCPTEALVLIGRSMGVEEVVREVLKDEHFYRNSGGGVTFSGGEPLMQLEFLLECLRRCRGQGLHTAVETCGHAPWEALEAVARETDLFLFDLKHTDADVHTRLTAVSNALLLENFERLARQGCGLVARVPVIPGLNDGDENLDSLIKLLIRTAPHAPVNLLPYHRLGRSKYRRLGIPYGLEELEPPSPERMEAVRRLFADRGLSVTVGG
jgi:pyruvate formate lyase activating enzyme